MKKPIPNIILFLVLVAGISVIALLSVYKYAELKGTQTQNTKTDSIEKLREKTCIIEALWYEARSEHEIGIRAVMSVIQNRKMLGDAKSSLHYRFPKTYCGVIHAPYQFSYRNDYPVGTHVPIPSVEGMPYVDAGKLLLIKDIADEVIRGEFKNNFALYTLYYTKTNVHPNWIKKMQKVVTIDQHVFYKPKNLGTISELTATKEK